jgi:hypothetical protein
MEVGFAGIILFNEESQFEFYSLDAHRHISPKTMLGIQLGSISSWQKQNNGSNNQKFVSIGCKWNLLNSKRWYVDPLAHLIYQSFHNNIAYSKYRGIGINLGIGAGVRYRKWKFGGKIQSHCTYGLLDKFGGTQVSYKPFIGFNYGIHLAYTL